jgi:hypothetical protein
MNPDFYSKETIDAKLELIHQIGLENKETSERIEVQTIKTNGRVTVLEKEIKVQGDEVKKWKHYVTAGAVVAAAMGAPGVLTILNRLL